MTCCLSNRRHEGYTELFHSSNSWAHEGVSIIANLLGCQTACLQSIDKEPWRILSLVGELAVSKYPTTP